MEVQRNQGQAGSSSWVTTATSGLSGNYFAEKFFEANELAEESHFVDLYNFQKTP